MRIYFKISIYLLLLLLLLTMPKENRRRFYTSEEVTKMLYQEDEIAALECLTKDIENRQAVGEDNITSIAAYYIENIGESDSTELISGEGNDFLEHLNTESEILDSGDMLLERVSEKIHIALLGQENIQRSNIDDSLIAADQNLNSDEDDGLSNDDSKRKRKANPSKWKQTINKKKRAAGDEYFGWKRDKHNGKWEMVPKEKRKMGSFCNKDSCRRSAVRHCNMFNYNECATIFEMFWKSADRIVQNTFIKIIGGC